MSRCVALLFLLSWSLLAHAAPWHPRVRQHRNGGHYLDGHVDHPWSLDLHSRAFDLRHHAEVHEVPAHTDDKEFIVKFKARSPTGLVRKHLERAGAKWVHLLARNTYHVYTSHSAAREMQRIPGVTWVGPLTSDMAWHLKVDSRVGAAGMEAHVHTDVLRVFVHPLTDPADVISGEVLESGAVEVECKGCSHIDWNRTVTDLVARGEGKVRWVEHRIRARTLNKFVRGIGESGVMFQEPFKHLTGKGHVVGVGDTGIDHDHCFFFDAHQPIRFNRLNANHRKIVRYDYSARDGSSANEEDVDEGHGTHIVGTILGAMDPESSYFNPDLEPYHGLLPDAKVAFTDLARAGDTVDSITLPGSMITMLQNAHEAGARVHSHSWGGSLKYYTSYATEVDDWMIRKREDLVIFAAGNEADRQCERNPRDPLCDKYTVMAPSVAKNCVGVGASMAPIESWQEMGEGNYLLTVKSGEYLKKYTIVKGYFGPKEPVLDPNLKLAAMQPATGCESPFDHSKGRLDNPGDLRGKIAVVMRGDCFFTVKVEEAEKAGALGLIVVNHISGDPIIMGKEQGYDTHITIPAFMIGQKDGKELLERMKVDQELTANFRSNTDPDPHKTIDNLSAFSSRGPTDDLRFKPDVVAVGEYVHSARSDANPLSHNCDLIPAMGTSMATPQVSALAVKIRQWLEQDGNTKDASGSLVKAFLVQAAVPLTGLVDRNATGDWEQLGVTPSFYQGHGRVQLDTVLPHPNNPLDLFFDHHSTLKTGGEKVYCVKHAGDKHGFRATLAWTDARSHQGSKWHLVNDLDLKVIDPSGIVWTGNGIENQVRDAVNNVEKVRIPSAPAGLYRVVVAGHSIPETEQEYSVVVSGLESAECHGCSADNDCSGNGACEEGTCKCKPGFEGDRCDRALDEIPPSNKVEGFMLPVWGWKVWTFRSSDPVRNIRVKVHRLDGESDPDVYIRHGEVPDMLSWDARDDTCSICGKKDQIDASYHIEEGVSGTFFIAVHVGCCHNATFNLELITDAVDSGKPKVTGASRSAGGPGDQRLVFTGNEAVEGVDMWLFGEHLGGEGDDVTVQYGKYRCTPVEWVSDKVIHCKTQPGTHALSANLIVEVGGKRTESAVTIVFESSRSRYDVFGLRTEPCMEWDACPSTTRHIHFNYFVAEHGGGFVYIMGQKVGERLPGSSGPMVEYVRYGDKQECTVQMYIHDDVLLCTTRRDSKGENLTLEISINGDVIAVPPTIATLSFARAPKLTHVSREENPAVVPSQITLTYKEGKQGNIPLFIFGENLGDAVISLNEKGQGQDTEQASHRVIVTYGTRPTFANFSCKVELSGETMIKCFTAKDSAVAGGAQYTLRVIAQGVQLLLNDAVYVVGAPTISGLIIAEDETKKWQGKERPFVAVPSAWVDSGKAALWLRGMNLGTADDTFFVRLTYSNGSVQCPKAVGGDTEISCKLPTGLPVGQDIHPDVFINGMPVEGTKCYFRINPPVAVTGLSLTDQLPGSPHIDLDEEGKFYIFGDFQVLADAQLDVMVGGYRAVVLTMNSSVAVCLMDPRAFGKDLTLVLYGGGTKMETPSFSVTPARKEAYTEPLSAVLLHAKTTWPVLPVFMGETIQLKVEGTPLPPVVPESLLAVLPVTSSEDTCAKIGMIGAEVLAVGEGWTSESTVSVRATPFTVCYSENEIFPSQQRFFYPLLVSGKRSVTPSDITAVTLNEGGRELWATQVIGFATNDTILGVSPDKGTDASFVITGQNLPSNAVVTLRQDGRVLARGPAKQTNSSSQVFPLTIVLDYDRAKEITLHYSIGDREQSLGRLKAAACHELDPMHCSGNGDCIFGKCVCNNMYRGETCNLPCPGAADVPCSGNGECLNNDIRAFCNCTSGFYGSHCNLKALNYTGGILSERSNRDVPTLIHASKAKYLSLQWFKECVVDIYLWKEEDIGNVKHAFAHSRGEAKAAQVERRRVLELDTIATPDDMFIGLYFFCDSVSFNLNLTDHLYEASPTPAPPLDEMEDLMQKYKVLAGFAGFAFGLVLVGLCYLLYRIAAPWVKICQGRRHRQLPTDDDGHQPRDFENNHIEEVEAQELEFRPPAPSDTEKDEGKPEETPDA
eukprot:Sspe_Gene.12837::Locus_4399_Transcript_1_1_Confidence_1.000_Length_6448::g.12837::m.12837